MKTCLVLLLLSLSACLTTANGFVNFHKVDSEIYRSGKLTQKDMVILKDKYDIKTILSLDSYTLDPDGAKEENEWATEQGILYINLPLNPIGHLNKDKVWQAYAILDKVEKPALVHCLRGSERTGILVGLWRIKEDNWTLSDTIKEMNFYGFSPLFKSWQDDFRDMVVN